LRTTAGPTLPNDRIRCFSLPASGQRQSEQRGLLDGIGLGRPRGRGAARPSGTENIYKIYAESFRGTDHLRRIQEDAQAIVSDILVVKSEKDSDIKP
jgi:phosphoglucomutase